LGRGSEGADRTSEALTISPTHLAPLRNAADAVTRDLQMVGYKPRDLSVYAYTPVREKEALEA